MPKITISFDADNAAFEDDGAHETQEVLRNVARSISEAAWSVNNQGPMECDGGVYDTNGNRIGLWHVQVMA